MTTSKIPVRNTWHMFVYAWNLFKLAPQYDALVEEAPDEQTLFLKLLAFTLERRTQRGIPKGYLSQQRRLSTVRGRIDVNRSVVEGAFEQGMAYCSFDELSFDTSRNRLVKATIETVFRNLGLRRALAKGGIEESFRRALVDLATVASVPISIDAFRRQTFCRNDAADRMLLALCEILIQSTMPLDGAGRSRISSYESDDNSRRKLYEHFIWRFYEHHLGTSGWTIEHGVRLDWGLVEQSPGAKALFPGMQLDIRLTSPDRGRRIIVDTKFKSMVTPGHYRLESLRSGDIYQIFTYINSQPASDATIVEAILLYPAINAQYKEFVQLPSVKLRFETIDLSSSWPQIEQELLEIVSVNVA